MPASPVASGATSDAPADSPARAPDSLGLYGSDTAGSVVRSAAAELVGTFILVFTGISVAIAALLDRAIAGANFDSLAVALAFGLVLVALVTALGHVSGAHFNPAVSCALAATGHFPARLLPAYVVAQLLGAVLAALAAWVIFGDPAREEVRLAATYPVEGATVLRALVAEVLVTFILVFVVVSVATDERVPAPTAPVAVGFALAAGVFIGGPVSGGAVNPARALGPMLVAGDLSSFWVYIVGPLVGGLLAALLYDRFIRQAEAPA